ncbi:MAG: xylulokinase [Chloroflexi bacterium]|nr:xylulokinase [Chloroflexota bacterium]
MLNGILAHDLGTTGNKATLFDAATGAAVAAVFEPYTTAYPHAQWAEQDPADWCRAVYDGTRRLLEQAAIPPGDIAVVSFSGMMNGALAVDAEGAALRSAILWADQRATVEATFLAERYGMARVYQVTGNRATPSCSAAKILWIQRHQPEIYRRTHLFLQAKDYAAFLLSGVFATDYSDASNTNLFDLERRVWAADLAEAAGLDIAKLPPIYPSTTVIGRVTPQAAALTGLLAGTPVVIGGGDGACATVGAGSVRPGDAYTYIGSSSWMAVTADRPLYDPQMRTFNLAHLDPRLTFPLGSMQSAGGAFDWLERLLRGDGDARLYDELSAAAAAVPPGADGLLFLPYLLGERSPYWNPQARGAFVGLTMAHGRPEMARAVLEGVAFNLRLILDALQAQAAGITAMRLIGGGAQGALWRQILADVFGLPILLPALLAEATSLGAAIAGGVGVGLYRDFGVAQQFVQVHAAERPDPAAQARYAELYPLFAETYRALEPVFGKLV